ncbi:hypothetical protein ACOMHN_017356 [Nucella lapillus]
MMVCKCSRRIHNHKCLCAKFIREQAYYSTTTTTIPLTYVVGVPCLRLVRALHRSRSSDIRNRVEGLSSPLFGIVGIINPCLTLSASSAPSFNRALEDGFGQRIVAIHMVKPCKLAAF